MGGLLPLPAVAQLGPLGTYALHPYWGVGVWTTPGYLPETLLQLSKTDSIVGISWPYSTSNAVLQTTTSLSPTQEWIAVTNQPVESGANEKRTVTLATTNDQQFFRLCGLETNRIPVFEFAIFYDGVLEFSTGNTMFINGRVHANGPIYTGSSSSLTFGETVTTASDISSPPRNGTGPPWLYTGAYNGTPPLITNTPVLSLSVSNDPRILIEMPALGENPNSPTGQMRLFNQAQVVLLISDTTVTAKIQASVSGAVPGADPSPITITSYLTNAIALSNTAVLARDFPFLTLTNSFYDQREDKTIVTTQVDVGKYAKWITTNSSVLAKFPSGSGTYPTILYATDNRPNTASQLSGVRLVNGAAPPRNGGLGWSLATPNPLYVWGDYNVTNATMVHSSYLASTNTTATIPSALMSDAVTLLSGSWQDSTSFTASSSGPNASSTITVNAAILTGIVASTGNTAATFSGGVHNLPRLLENWTASRDVWLNTSLINLYNSTKATGQFVPPGSGSYYTAPTRHFSFDPNFKDPSKLPPGTPLVSATMPPN